MGANQTVFHEGDESDGMYAILEGQVRIFKRDSEGHEVDVTTMQFGDFFGEMALLDNKPRSATVVCLTACKLFRLDQVEFITILAEARSQKAFVHLLSVLSSNLRDVTEKYFKKELNQQMLHAKMELEQHRSLTQMVAGVAHELNTPLGIVNTAVNMIENRVKSDEMATLFGQNSKFQLILGDILEATQLAQSNTKRAQRLIQDFKKISVNQLTDPKETVNLVDLVKVIVELFNINTKQAALQVDIQDTLSEGDITWSGYPGYLTQVVLNLLSNIERYAYPKRMGGRIDIGITTDNEKKPPCFVITVQDFGQGIAPEHLVKIFEPFFTTGRSQGGTGLGLAIVYNIVTKALKGTIEVKSACDQGTRFTVTFPQTITD
jgi:signal transduction histidine kinase